MFIRNDYILKHSVDARWFLALKSIRRPLLLNYYLISNEVLEREKQKVLSDKSYNPQFEYQNLDPSAIKTAKNNLLNLRRELWHEESNQSIKEAYLEKIDELLLEMDMLLSTTEGRFEDFANINIKKYGLLKPEIVSRRILLVQERFNLFSQIIKTENIKLAFPSSQTMENAKVIFSGGPDLEISNDLYTSDDICSLWQNEINKFANGWKVIVSNTSLYIFVNNKKRTVYIPLNLKMSKIKMRELFVHEVGVHVYRREIGKKAKLQLLSIGLSGYQIAEEGIALVREQLVGNKVNYYSGFDKYLALMYALGKVDGEKKDFKQTFTMLKTYYEKRSLKKHSSEVSKEIAINRAWGSTVRIFRGGNPTVPGCCFMRDKIYREGNIYIWELLSNSPDFFKDVYSGKFDPGQLKHRLLVEKFK